MTNPIYPTNTDHAQPVAIVTGGAQGIGKGVARQLVAAGYQVMIADAEKRAGAATVQEYATYGEIHFRQTDVGDEVAVAALVAATVERYGRIDALVNNAGIGGPGVDITDLTLADWNRVIATNLTGPMLCTKHATPYLRKSGGAIVNIASTRALQSEANTEPYSASKGGIVGLTHALAMSLGPTVRVNAVSPGWIDVRAWQHAAPSSLDPLRPVDHQQHPVGRVGTVEDIAQMVAYLLSDAAGFITGQNFVVDGGMTRKMMYGE